MITKFIKLAAINLILCFFLLELSLIYFNKYLSTNILFYFPNTSLKQNLLIKNKMRLKSKRGSSDKIIFKKNNLSKKLMVPKIPFFESLIFKTKLMVNKLFLLQQWIL